MVFNRNLELGGKKPGEALPEIQNYIRYMQEQIEFYAANQRKQYDALEKRVAALEKKETKANEGTDHHTGVSAGS